MFNDTYNKKKILITGHTGFKGSWLAFWLTQLGAEVIGYSLPAPTKPSHFEHLELDIVSLIGDTRDGGKLKQVFREYKPDAVFHLAAQTLVRLSYLEPVETFASNVFGTINVLEACRHCETVRGVVIVTSDKCYENEGWVWGYRENDAMGGYDPYSASKGCTELVVSSWRRSYFNVHEFGRKHQTLLASARAGNVIGGGDWAADRLIPDIVSAASKNQEVLIRNPHATRPWQHVLDALSGYLLLGQKLLEGKTECAEGWNFGPDDGASVSVREVVERARNDWSKIAYHIKSDEGQPHEAADLRLDCSKARSKLKWKPTWDTRTALSKTLVWYKSYYEEGQQITTPDDLQQYLRDAAAQHNEWAV